MGQCMGSHSSSHDTVTEKEGGGKKRKRAGGDARAAAKEAAPPVSNLQQAQKASNNADGPMGGGDKTATTLAAGLPPLSPPAAAIAADPDGIQARRDAELMVSSTNPNFVSDNNHNLGPTGGGLVNVDSIVNRIEQGSTYSWLAFSHANPHLVSEPLVRSRRQLATLAPHKEWVSCGQGTTTSPAPALRSDSPHPATTDPNELTRSNAGGGGGSPGRQIEPTAATRNGSQLVTGALGVLRQAPAPPVVSSLEVSARSEGAEEKKDKNTRRETAPKPAPAAAAANSANSVAANYEAASLGPGAVFVRRPGEIRGRRFAIRSCTRATVLLLDLCGSVSVTNCSRCFLFVGPTVGTVELEQCQGCVLVAACGQVRLRHCHNMILSLLTAALPMLENSTAIGLTSLSGWYAYNEMPLHLRSAHLSPFINNYSTVRDLTPPPKPLNARGGAGNRPGVMPSPQQLTPVAAKQGKARHRNFFYLDPWDFDLVIWRLAIATALRNRGLSRNVSFDTGGGATATATATAFSSRRQQVVGRGLALFSSLNRDGHSDGDDASTGSFHSAVTAEDDEPVGDSGDDESPADKAGGRDGARRGKGRSRGKQRGLGQRTITLASAAEKFDHDEARDAKRTLTHVPLRLLDLPIATMTVTSAAATAAAAATGKEEEAKKKQYQQQGSTATTVTTTLQLPPLSPRSVEDVLGLYTEAMVAPTTLGACLIPRCFFAEKWRLKLFVVANKNGGWAIAQRVARDIELSRRQVFMEYARTVPAARWRAHDTDTEAHTGLLSPNWHPPPSDEEDSGDDAEGGEPHVKDTDADPTRIFEHRYIPLAYRCGPVLLLNTVELRCTETVMREYVAPTFYKLTEPPEMEQLRQQHQQQHGKEPTRKADNAPRPQQQKSKEEQRLQEEAELRRGVAIRRLFGEAIQRMSGQACVFFLALVAPWESTTANATPAGDAAAAPPQGSGSNSNTSPFLHANSEGDAGGEEPIGEHEVGDDNSAALSRYARRRDKEASKQRSNSGGGGGGGGGLGGRHHASVTRTQIRRLNGFRVFQPLSREEEDNDVHAQPGSGNDETGSDASPSDDDDDVGEAAAGASTVRVPRQRVREKNRNKRIARKTRAAAAGSTGAKAVKTAGFTEEDMEFEKSQEERVWPRCVLLNVTVPLHAVSLLQSNVFFKAAITSASTSGGYTVPAQGSG